MSRPPLHCPCRRNHRLLRPLPLAVELRPIADRCRRQDLSHRRTCLSVRQDARSRPAPRHRPRQLTRPCPAPRPTLHAARQLGRHLDRCHARDPRCQIRRPRSRCPAPPDLRARTDRVQHLGRRSLGRSSPRQQIARRQSSRPLPDVHPRTALLRPFRAAELAKPAPDRRPDPAQAPLQRAGVKARPATALENCTNEGPSSLIRHPDLKAHPASKG